MKFAVSTPLPKMIIAELIVRVDKKASHLGLFVCRKDGDYGSLG